MGWWSSESRYLLACLQHVCFRNDCGFQYRGPPLGSGRAHSRTSTGRVCVHDRAPRRPPCSFHSLRRRRPGHASSAKSKQRASRARIGGVAGASGTALREICGGGRTLGLLCRWSFACADRRRALLMHPKRDQTCSGVQCRGPRCQRRHFKGACQGRPWCFSYSLLCSRRAISK